MTLQQLKYLLAIEEHRHFVEAARHCHVTQPTLSMMVHKLEEEIGIKIFDRSKKPITPTKDGELILEQAREVLAAARRFEDIASELRGEMRGTLKLGIIPTVAPYLISRFLPHFLNTYPDIHLHITELTTDELTTRLKRHQLDAGILATPLDDPAIREHFLYHEEFVAYVSPDNSLLKKRYLLPDDINPERLWLLEEGHCLRTQIINLCELRRSDSITHRLEYESGSIEALKKMVDAGQGVTILPELAINDLSEEEHNRLRFFKPPAPVREISLITHRHFARQRLLQALAESIRKSVPDSMKKKKRKSIIFPP